MSHLATAGVVLKESTWNTIGNPPTITSSFYGTQAAGDFIVVIIGWSDSTSSIVSVTDTLGSTYTLAVGPTVNAGNATQAIYYAKNVGATTNPNTITVTFNNSAVPNADLRIAKYSGVNTTAPFDAGVGATGSGTALNSGNITTTNANDLLIAGNYLETTTVGIGSGFTQEVLTDQYQFLADKIVSATGSYNATATQDSCCYWVMQIAAFKAAASDTTPPSAPTNLTLTVASPTQINASWTASTDNVGVTGYEVQRCTGSTCTTFVAVGSTTTATTFNNTGLTGSTTYRYRIKANDAAGNFNYSAIVNATTPVQDTQAPTAPANLTLTVISPTQINTSWTASTDNVGVTGYDVQRCTGSTCTNFVTVGSTTTTTTFNNTGLTAATTYRYRIKANDAATNFAYSSIVNATTQTSDTQPPTVPTGLAASSITSTTLTLTWTASTDNSGTVAGYEVQRCLASSCTWSTIGSPTTNSLSVTGLTASTAYKFQVRAKDGAATPNWSAYSTAFSVTTISGSDSQVPSVPTGLTATVVSSTQINLAWNASTDNVGVTGYEVQRCLASNCVWASIGTPSATNMSSTGLTPSTAYRFQVRARDAVPNWSAFSSAVNATTVSQVETVTYQYDARGRLKKVTRNGGTNNNVQTDYTYDKANNRKTVVTTGSSN